ncbi:MAG TPA: hypothetical protein VHR65_00485 [Solirubrobacterales bacterium]|nr:hypothetical protein [Solirubrobacterales bacterium]
MTREGTRLIAVFAAAALAAGLLGACGSSDSSSTGSTSTAGSASETNSPGNDSQSGSQAQQNGANASGPQEQQNGAGNGSKGVTAKEVSVPLKVSGGGSAQFRSRGGDNSIQEFGEEAAESELQEAAEAVHGFYVTRAEGDWSGACSYLSKAMLKQLEQLAASSTEIQDKRCPSFLAAFTSPLSAAEWREITTVDAGSLRHEGEQAFLIYYGAGKTVYAMPLKQEEGAWRVGALSGDALG